MVRKWASRLFLYYKAQCRKHVTNVEKYDGSVWTNTTNYPVATAYVTGCGTQTAALSAGGNNNGPYIATVNKFDGTTWTAGTSIPYGAEAGNLFGIQTAAIFFGGGDGGSPGYPAQSWSYNGTSWTSTPSLNNDNRYWLKQKIIIK